MITTMTYCRTHLLSALAIAATVAFTSIAHATPPDSPPSSPQASAPTQDSALSTQDSSTAPASDPRYGLLSPLPSTGGIPAIYDHLYGPSDAELAYRAKLREYEKQLRLIKREYFRSQNASLMNEGLEQIREFTDAAAFKPMLEVFEDSPDGVRLAIFDHLAAQGEQGQAALAWAAIHFTKEDEAAMRHEATLRLGEAINSNKERRSQTPQPVLQILDNALRSNNHVLANNAGALAGAISALETIPLLMFAQATEDVAPADGDLAWIAIQTQQAYVANVTPVVGDDAGAFQPVIGVVSEGTILRVMDAVVVTYRTEIHSALVNMTTHDWGQSTEHLAYNMKAWWTWYNTEYVPFRNEQAAAARLAEQNASPELPNSSP